MALALSWNGFVDTDLQFSEFFSSDHTLVCRFMQHYPNAYEGPIIAENGSGTFVLGQGDYYTAGEGTKLYLAIGTQSRTFPMPLRAGEWHHLAVSVRVTATQRTYAVYLDGQQLGASMVVASSTAQMPSGTLRFGRRTTGKTVNGRETQFFGILDDVAVFSSAMTQAQVQNLFTTVPHLTGNEEALLAGYNFNEAPVHPRLKRPITFHGAASRIVVSAKRDNVADAGLLPLPTQQQPMDLPFAVGDVWKVVQGHDNPPGHHAGYASFTWDFIIAAEQQQGDVYPNGTDTAPLFASAAGKAVRVRESEPKGTTTPNIVEIEQAPGEYSGYLHVQQNSVTVDLNANATKGQQIARASCTGMGTCTTCNHLHFAVANQFGEVNGFVTFPTAFSDYQVKNGSSWINISRGVPLTGEIVRNPPTPQFGGSSLRPHSAVSRRPDRLDLVVTDSAGAVWSNRWAPAAFANNWDRWRPALSPMGTVNTPVEVVSRHPDLLDIFITGRDGKPYTGAWDQNVANAQWRGWWNVVSLLIPDDAPIAAVSRHPEKLDIFVAASDGGIYTAAWDRNMAGEQWRGWWRIGDLTVKPGAPVAAVARDANKLDIFVAGNDGGVYTAAWDANANNQQWTGWRKILDADVPPAGHVTAVSRHPDKLDIFVVARNQGAFTAAWEAGVANGQWRGWWRIGDEVFAPGIPITAVSRHPDKLDTFVAGNDGRVWTAAWELGAANNQWQGWRKILDGKVAAASAIAAVARDPDKLDIFAVTPEGSLQTAAWDQHVAAAQWQGWWRIG